MSFSICLFYLIGRLQQEVKNHYAIFCKHSNDEVTRTSKIGLRVIGKQNEGKKRIDL